MLEVVKSSPEHEMDFLPLNGVGPTLWKDMKC